MFIPRTGRDVVKVLGLRDNILESGETVHPTHRMAVGTLEQTKDEASRFTALSSPFDTAELMPDLADRVRATMKGSHAIATLPYSWEYVLGEKHGDKSPGEPWMLRHGEYKDVLENIEYDKLIEICKLCESEILEGNLSAQEFTFLVHSKFDGYSLSKFTSGRFRTVQGADMMTFFILKRWYGPTVDKLYEYPDWMNVKWNVKDLPRTLYGHSHKRLTAGWDVKAMDRNVNYDDTVDVVNTLDSLSYHPIPEAISEFAIEYNSSGPLVFADGEIMQRCGGNPSGTYLTTILNCMTHFKWMERLKDVVFSPDNELRFSICGDDNLHSVVPGTYLRDGTPIEDFERVRQLVTDELCDSFGAAVEYEPVLTPAGVQLWSPPGLCAPFLDYVLHEEQGFQLCLPKAPYRRCRKAISFSESDVEDPRMTPEVLLGVKGAMAPFYALKALRPTAPSPYPMQLLDELLSKAKKDNPESTAWSSDFSNFIALDRCIPYIEE